MIIRKLFKFENTHIVRGCSTVRCRSSIHGHSYKIEVLFESDYLDNAQMIYDFGLMKSHMKDLIDSFDHGITLWNQDNEEYIKDMKKYSSRWVVLPVSPTCEQFSRVIYLMIDRLMNLTNTINGEKNVSLHSIIVHETDTGYAQCFQEDAYSQKMGSIDLDEIVFSDAIKAEWEDYELFEKLKRRESFTNPADV